MKLLSLSDVIVDFIYSPSIRTKFGDVKAVFGCGDLPYYYLEYVVNKLDVPVYYVRGNHEHIAEICEKGSQAYPFGATDLHRRIIREQGLLIAGIEGSLRYREGPYQYTQYEMWQHVSRLVPGLLYNRLKYGRALDIFVSHAPPWGIHDQPDLPHQGIKAFLWLLRVFRPRYHFHGHIHIFQPGMVIESVYEHTKVINSFAWRLTEIEI
jgi:Icc-related predicted phosphoesterase